MCQSFWQEAQKSGLDLDGQDLKTRLHEDTIVKTQHDFYFQLFCESKYQ